MCGIAGISPLENDQDIVVIKKMVNSICHRGPDQENIFKNRLGIFGFLRLKIIDLSEKSNQPFISENQKIQIFYNGEIYNYKELKEAYFPNLKFKSDYYRAFSLTQKYQIQVRDNQFRLSPKTLDI